MPSAEHFPLHFPADARRVFGADDCVRRIARVAQWGSSARLLELGCGPSALGVTLAKELGCSLIEADEDPAVLERVKERAKAYGLGDRLEVRKVDPAQLSFNDGQFDGIFSLGRVLMPLSSAVKQLRRYLAPRGRLCLVYPVRVSRHPARSVLEHWEARLGEPLMLPRDCLQMLEKAGYEPEAVDTLSDVELDDFYRALEPFVALGDEAKPLRDEMDLHRTAGGRGSFSYGLVIGRRKEPGERPPVSRNE